MLRAVFILLNKHRTQQDEDDCRDDAQERVVAHEDQWPAWKKSSSVPRPSGSSRAERSRLPHEPIAEPLAIRLDQPGGRMWKMDRQHERAAPGDVAQEAAARAGRL